MLENLTLDNFKSFRRLAFRPCALNVLTGLNGAGKSSFVQGLLFLREMVQRSSVAPWYVNLNSPPLSFGTYSDLRYAYAQSDDDTVRVSFKICGIPLEYRFVVSKTSTADEEVEVLIAESSAMPNLSGAHVRHTIGGEEEWARMLKAIREIQYISAYRLPPQQEHAYSALRVRDHNWGAMGEFAVAYLAEYGQQTLVHPSLCRPEVEDQHLQQQVDAWMSVVSPGAFVCVENVVRMNRTLLSVSFARGVNRHPFRPQNVGFGISYVLPLLVMILRAQKGDCLIVENPEAHLHPKGQAELGRLLSLAAASGVQVFVETHSDHVLNGIRVAVKQGVIPSDDVNVAFFERVTESGPDGSYEQETKVERIGLLPSGEFDHFPQGFMDEWNIQLLKLLEP